ncbi:MAG: nitrilase-related carbon-nitrogen hydrolase, partial [candidate division Zixibacteria bacterium]
QQYDKINLFEPMNEPQVYFPGDQPGIIDTQFGRFGVAICYDLRFPELFAQLAALNVQWIIVPAAFPKERISDWWCLLAERAREVGRHVIGVNAVGDDGVNLFGGTSMVCGPGGEIIVQADDSSEKIIDLEL